MASSSRPLLARRGSVSLRQQKIVLSFTHVMDLYNRKVRLLVGIGFIIEILCLLILQSSGVMKRLRAVLAVGVPVHGSMKKYHFPSQNAV